MAIVITFANNEFERSSLCSERAAFQISKMYFIQLYIRDKLKKFFKINSSNKNKYTIQFY